MTSTITSAAVRDQAAIRVSGAVSAALSAGRPVVALESTIFSCLGLPAPANGDALRRCLAAVREGGAEPAVTAILDGQARVGLEAEDEDRILTATRKVAERDIPVAVAQGLATGRCRRCHYGQQSVGASLADGLEPVAVEAGTTVRSG